MTLVGLRNGPFRRGVSAITLAAFTLSVTDCVSLRWHPTAVTNLSLEKEKIAGRDIRLGSEGGFVTLKVATLDVPYVNGKAISGTGLAQFDVRTATSAEFVTLDAKGEVRQGTLFDVRAVERNPAMLESRDVRFITSLGNVVLRNISRVDFPWVEGRLGKSDGPIRLDLRRVSGVELTEIDGGRTLLRTISAIGVVYMAVLIIVILTKQSCPFVYVDRGNGWEFVGEAYSGAAFRATQRDDLLPLPDVGRDNSVRVRLRNEARETQYTDRAELVVVDHAPNVRALSTFDGHPVLVGPARSPVSSVDGRGRDVSTLVAARDERLWETPPDSLAGVNDEPLEDQLTAEFALSATGTPVLELVGGNTAWLDLVFGRFFAAMGDRLSDYIAQGNQPAARERIERWREREGVDLTVEQQVNGEWRKVAVVPPVGPAALREIAVPLRSRGDGASGTVKVRLRGGLGFWRIDRLGLSVQDDGASDVRHVPPREARTGDGRSELDAVRVTDGRYNALAEMNERLDMAFTLPPLAEGRARSAFLFTSGYYNVHPSVQARWLPGTLKAIRDEPGALSRFGRDLAREYSKALQAASVKSGSRRDDR